MVNLGVEGSSLRGQSATPAARDGFFRGVLGSLQSGLRSALPAGTRPLVWLDPTVSARVTAKRLAANADWLSVKALADQAVGNTMPAFTVTAATNASPCVITISQAVPWTTTEEIYIGGGTGAWAGLNSIDFPGLVATKTGTNTFSVPVNSSAFGSFAGQSLALFPYLSSGFSGGGPSSLAGGYQGSSWYDVAFALGLAYKQLGNSPSAYGTRGVQLLDYIVSLGVKGIRRPVSTDSYYATRFTLPAIAFLFDWCYDLLSSQQKTAATAAVNFWWDLRTSALDWNGPLQSNYFTGHLWGYGSVGIATASDNGRSAEIIAGVRTQHDTYVLGGFNTTAAGGYPFEAYGYGTNGYNRGSYYTEALRTSGGTDLTAEAPQLADSLIYNLRPDRYRASDEGDYPGSYVGIVIPDYPLVLAYLLRGTTRGQWMKWLFDHLAAVAGQSAPTVARLLWYDVAGASLDYRLTEPTVHYSPGDERLFWRSDWNDTAVWSHMNGAAGNAVGSHQARTAGHIAVQRGADNLLVYAGQWKGVGGITGSPEQFALSGGLANTLFHADGGAYNFSGDTYWGGQGYWGVNATTPSVDTVSNVAYMNTDLTSAYHTNNGGVGRTLTTFRRANVKCGSGVNFVYDYLVRGSTSYTDNWRWHFNDNGTLTQSSGVVTATIGASKLFLRAFHLTTPTYTIDRDYVNFSSDTGSPLTRRLIVSEGGAPSTTMRCCTVLQATGSGVSAMGTSTALVATGNTHYGASVVDTNGDVLFAMFSADNLTLQDSMTVSIP